MSNKFRKRHAKDCDKTKAQLINELMVLRQEIAKLKKSDAERHRAFLTVQEAYEYAESVVNAVREPLVVLDRELRVASANYSFYQTFKLTPEESEGQLFFKLGNRQWDIPRLKTLLNNVLTKNTTLDHYRVEQDFPAIGHRTMLLNASRICRGANKVPLILVGIEDITELKRADLIAKEVWDSADKREELSGNGSLVVLDANLRVVRRDN